ncbi:MAG: NAD(P)H:quinone oxidoreductase [Candidatus Lokiarchaeota archaeon]|nr:NAD(P)H:quinone oxidoreductase [Candidatus Lokiarchaeota archaeon]
MSEKKPKILVLFYSMYGHTYKMAEAVIEGIKEENGEPILKQVEELMPEKYWDDNVKNAKTMMKDIAFADPRNDLKGIDGIIIGTPTRYGNMTSQMRNFWDQTGEDWQNGTLIGKPAAIFVSTATQHGGQETTIMSTALTLLHHGALIVGLPYSNQEQMRIDELSGGSPYGASTIAGTMGERTPSKNELQLAIKLGRRLTKIATKLL